MQQKFTGLKKEFKRKDVERMRNLIKGKAGDSAEVQIGYTKRKTEYKEGDIWEDGHKTWTIKKGIKQTVSKLDKIRKETLMPLCCPNCNNVMKNSLDKNCYKTHKKCLECITEDQRNLMNNSEEGGHRKKWERINKINQIKSNIARLNDLESAYISKIKQSNNSYISEQGDVERWVGNSNTDSLIKEVKETATKMREKFNKELENL